MSFKLTEEQLMIQSMVRELAREEFAPRAMERDQKKLFPADNLEKLAELGLMGMMVPPEYGGSGADTVSYVLALGEVAYACASTAVGRPVTSLKQPIETGRDGTARLSIRRSQPPPTR